MALVAADAMREATERTAGLSDAAPAALACLLPVDGGRSIDELRRVVGLTPSGGVRLVDRLAHAGLAERRPGVDKRTVMVVLTARGSTRRRSRRARRPRRGPRASLLAPLAATERAASRRSARRSSMPTWGIAWRAGPVATRRPVAGCAASATRSAAGDRVGSVPPRTQRAERGAGHPGRSDAEAYSPRRAMAVRWGIGPQGDPCCAGGSEVGNGRARRDVGVERATDAPASSATTAGSTSLIG